MIRLFILALLAATTANAEENPFVEFKALKPEYSLRMAQVAMEYCQNEGFQIGVMVTDRFGIPQVFLRDRYAGVHVFEMTERKAWTAVTFRTATSELELLTQAGKELSAIRGLEKAMPVGGGLPVLDGDGSLVAGIAVSGAPGGTLDEDCAAAGIEAVQDDIAF
jgi:uncharacterized protein GlcG (DUF336 family)|tara:strand:- start:353 stop:844 length:492 start_codon:yes stop_codon:yes gene_type:complete